MMRESHAADIFQTAINTGRAAELLQALFEGAGVTLQPDPNGGRWPELVIIPASEIGRVTKESF
jgi:hypothetical protein